MVVRATALVASRGSRYEQREIVKVCAMQWRQARTWRFRARTDIWTGDVDRKGEWLVPMGLLGSIRWWFEVLVRGLGGFACDPRPKPEGNACPPDKRSPFAKGHHCVVCELFGCTGWARKFRFDVLDREGNLKRKAIQTGHEFHIKITPLRPIRNEEWALLDATFRLISNYGAVGGKTVLKPSDERKRQGFQHHKDFGLITLIEGLIFIKHNDIDLICMHVANEQWRRSTEDRFGWASLKNFWFLEGFYLARKSCRESTFNRVLGRPEPKKLSRQHPSDRASAWLAGKPGVSKKVFSFKGPVEQTFGFTCPGTVEIEEIRRRLKDVGADPNAVKGGDDILKDLFPSTAGYHR